MSRSEDLFEAKPVDQTDIPEEFRLTTSVSRLRWDISKGSEGELVEIGTYEHAEVSSANPTNSLPGQGFQLFIPSRHSESGEWQDETGSRYGQRIYMQSGEARMPGSDWFVPNLIVVEGLVSVFEERGELEIGGFLGVPAGLWVLEKWIQTPREDATAPAENQPAASAA